MDFIDSITSNYLDCPLTHALVISSMDKVKRSDDPGVVIRHGKKGGRRETGSSERRFRDESERTDGGVI